MQYFYIVVYTIVGDDLTMLGLNLHQLTEANLGADIDIDIYR